MSETTDTAIGVVRWLLGPKGQRSMPLIVLGLVLFAGFELLYWCGRLESLGLLVPYVKAEQWGKVESLERGLNELVDHARDTQEIVLAREIRDRTAACLAAKDKVVRDYLSQDIDERQAQYKKLTGRYYPSPPCS